MELSGWGRYPRVETELHVPISRTPACDLVATSPSLLPRGMGRSYGDAALGDVLLSTRQLNRLRAFDEQAGVLRCDAGVTLAEIIEVLLPRGWFLPVTPGTRFVSVGGAIASDVHGKNHHLDGCFSEFVDSFSLACGDGVVRQCSRTEHPELFFATCGGMGLTGVILDATLRLRRVTSAYIEQVTYKAQHLQQALELFEEHQRSTYSVAWIDCVASGKALGRSLLMVGEHARDQDRHLCRKLPLSVPFDAPAALLNHYSIQAFNSLYFHRIRRPRSEQRVDYRTFFYPLDGIDQWNRLYGRQGFIQYQFVVPREAGLEGLSTILQRIAASGRGSFLAVLKAFGAANESPLSFPLEGYTLALDFKMQDDLLPLLDELDRMVLDHGGRLYLAKDARMSAATFRQSYPRWEAFQALRERYGARGKFISLQAQRLGLE
jgi:FAD/FMN-containing dehydrogenase